MVRVLHQEVISVPCVNDQQLDETHISHVPAEPSSRDC